MSSGTWVFGGRIASFSGFGLGCVMTWHVWKIRSRRRRGGPGAKPLGWQVSFIQSPGWQPLSISIWHIIFNINFIFIVILTFNKTCAFRNPNPLGRNNPYSNAGSTHPHTSGKNPPSDRDRTSATPVELWVLPSQESLLNIDIHMHIDIHSWLSHHMYIDPKKIFPTPGGFIYMYVIYTRVLLAPARMCDFWFCISDFLIRAGIF